MIQSMDNDWIYIYICVWCDMERWIPINFEQNYKKTYNYKWKNSLQYWANTAMNVQYSMQYAINSNNSKIIVQ